ncbi:invasion associated locus B family protein [Actibacterium ureilyticum]|uniref:invasion associated locus B family protein n=1 Tax=Actibacterium ureilyticum TaxID=1590614 RepID=UPI000BAB0170|nr:invasion associated locus B family protein [Actibacterium ureilyticum]
MLRRAFIYLLLTALPVLAQDLEGNDTPGNWRVKHFQTFGIWNSMCDEREENGTLNQRCYIRYVDVFSPRPEFAAQFLFIVAEEGRENVEFGLEPGTLFSPNGFRIDTGDTVRWRTRRPGCLTGLSCTFRDDGAAELLGAMTEGDAMRFVFIDRHGNARDITWPLDGFADALADFRSQSRARALLPAS